MKQEDKDLLLKDLCARLPYGVFCEGITTDIDIDTDRYYKHKVKGVLSDIHHYNSDYATIGLMSECNLETIKPYLFPLSSMTEEQTKELENLGWNFDNFEINNINECFGTYREYVAHLDCFVLIDWLNKYHFDYRGLIEKGLAIDATVLEIYK